MNKRLLAIADLIKDGIGLADVGTDHGYLPAHLALNGYRGALYASDIREGPLAAAKKTAAEAGLSERIHFLLCDGLRLCPSEKIDTIVIAGMGGDMIVKILDEAEWCMDPRYHLILQPMTKAEVLRYWLVYNGFSIRAETLTEDGGIIYQIIEAYFGGETILSDAELFVGKRCLCRDRMLYGRQLQSVYTRFQKAAEGMTARGETPRLKLYREIADQLTEMRGQT